MHKKKCKLMLSRKILQNVIARVILIWVALLEWVAIVGICQEHMGIFSFICLQVISLSCAWVSYDIINAVMLIKIDEDNLIFFLANNKVVTYKENQLLIIKKRYVTLGGFRFIFQDGKVLKSNNQAMRLFVLKNGAFYTDEKLSALIKGIDSAGKR